VEISTYSADPDLRVIGVLHNGLFSVSLQLLTTRPIVRHFAPHDVERHLDCAKNSVLYGVPVQAHYLRLLRRRWLPSRHAGDRLPMRLRHPL
jgi:hypothetical protein